ncbi:hypothetical protein ABGB17_09800 [Sphaerisporangium sp. B11E5]|uniref:hypothetical protein n=1 Tax=Sphaerisporangium sp. B11E5 TaxID=3153563 RepID=UPI00325EE621
MHGPSAGPSTWVPVAEKSRTRGHGNAGLFVPLPAAGHGDRVSACLFVDATPPPGGVARAAQFPPFPRDLADPAGVLPSCTRRWDAVASRGRPVHHVAGERLHRVVAPGAVADRLTAAVLR